MMNNRPIDEWTPGFRASDMPVVEGGEPNPLEDAPADVPPGTNGCDPKPTNNLPPPPGAPMVDHALYYARRGWPVFRASRRTRLPSSRAAFTRQRPTKRISASGGDTGQGDDRRAHGAGIRRLGR